MIKYLKFAVLLVVVALALSTCKGASFLPEGEINTTVETIDDTAESFNNLEYETVPQDEVTQEVIEA